MIIVEDDRWSRELMSEWVSARSELEIAACTASGDEALSIMRTRRSAGLPNPDLILLDVNLPGMSGIEFLERLEEVPYVIFTTAYEKYAIKAFEIGAVDYLVKPIEHPRFEKAIDRFISIMENKIPFDPYPAIEEMKDAGKYAKSLLDDATAAAYQERIVRHMEERRAYCDEDITLQKLARELSIPPHHLSQVLNMRIRKSYYAFVNSYRVEEAKKMLADPKRRQLSILEIANMAGFKSKSVFNAVFKEFTGMTPREYREKSGG